MPNRELIGQGWASYRDRLLQGAGPLQIQESRRAFYAGAAHLFGSVNSAIGPDEVSEDESFAILEDIQAEIKAYVEAIAQGKA